MGTAISLVSPASIGNLYYLRLEYKIHPIERQLPSDRELRTRAETDSVLQLAARFTTARETERSLVRRLLTHERAEAIIAGLLREHLAANGKELEPATRARNTRHQVTSPVVVSPPVVPSPVVAPVGVVLPPAPEPRAPRAERLEPARAERSEESGMERQRRRAPPTADGDRQRPERARVSSPGAARGRRLGSGPSSELSEEGIRYEVRSVSAADLASVETTGNGPTARTSSDEPTRDSGAADSEVATDVPPAQSAESLGASNANWEGPVDEAFVNVGRDDGVRTSDVQQALSNAGVSDDDTAYVRIRQRHTFIGVRPGLLDRVVSGLSGQKIAQRSVEAQPARPRQARR
jgi:ATP-dependent RNA helicase DeaD